MRPISMHEARYISVSINRPASEVFAFAHDPKNLPKWATGLSGSLKKEGDTLIAESPMGTIRIQFAKENSFGVLDHNVTLPNGEKFYNPMRVFPNGEGSEVVFTLYRQPNMSKEEFQNDEKTIRGDLERLKSILEE